MALRGLKVLDLSRLLPGPLCTHFLTRLGARVIKVEAVEHNHQGGDYTRNLAPHLFEAINAGKQSIAINLKEVGGKNLLTKLIKDADVLVEGNRPGTLKKIGLDYDSVKEINSKLIYCSISGYGATGPYSQRAGHDVNYQSLAGLLGISGTEGSLPPLVGFQPADGAGAMQAAMGIMAAIIHRSSTGKGQFVDISLTESAMSLGIVSLSSAVSGNAESVRGTGLLNGGLASYNIYETRDKRYLAVGALEPHFWQQAVKILKTVAFDDDVDFNNRESVAALFASKDHVEWQQVFAGSDVCVDIIPRPDEIVQHPQHVDRNVFQPGDISNSTTHMVLGPRLSDVPFERLSKAPLLGQHTEDILKELEISESEASALKSSNSVFAPALPLCTQSKPYRVKMVPDKDYWWCSCGKSSKQPFCDGSHKGTGFTPVKVTAEDDSIFPFCGCRKSLKAARCDGAHKKGK